MDDTARAFLLAENDQAWSQIRDIYATRDRLFGWYVAAVGGIFILTINLLPVDKDNLAKLPTVFVVVAILLVAIFSLALLLQLARLRFLAIEYTCTINRIRLAFQEQSLGSLAGYLVLPTVRDPRRMNRLDRSRYELVTGLSGVILTAGTAWLAWRYVPNRWIAVLSVLAIAVIWILSARWIHHARMERAVMALLKRKPELAAG